MDLYARSGHNDFILCLGYKGEKIENYFKDKKDWKINFIHTGETTNKAERLLKVKDKIKDDSFLVSYGDDLSDININDLIKFHKNSNKIVTLTAVKLISSFGIIELNENNEVLKFKEKPILDYFMNGGFYVMNKEIFDYMKPGYDLEKGTFEDLVKDNQITAFKHNGFWKSMNTLKDVIEFNELWKTTKPWVMG